MYTVHTTPAGNLDPETNGRCLSNLEGGRLSCHHLIYSIKYVFAHKHVTNEVQL